MNAFSQYRNLEMYLEIVPKNELQINIILVTLYISNCWLLDIFATSKINFSKLFLTI